MKKILLLGGSAQQVIAIETAKKLGYYTILCDYLSDNPGRYVADKFYLVSTTNIDEVLKVSQKENIDGILAYASDPAAVTASYIAEKLGLPGNPYKSVMTLCNKELFRAFLADNDFNTPVSKGYSTLEDAIKDITIFHLPVIIKPVDSSGSKGVTVLQSVDNLTSALSLAFSYSRKNRIIIEEVINKKHKYLIGGDIFVFEGKILLWGLLNCYRDPKVNPLVPVGKSYPLELEEDDLIQVKETLQRIVNKLHLCSGAVNVELLVDCDNKVYPIDIGPRSGGNMIPELLGYIFNLDIIEIILKVAMGESLVFQGKEEHSFYATHNLHTDKNGYFQQVLYSKELEPYIIKKNIYKKEGDRVDYFDNAAKALGIIFMHFPTKDIMNDILGNINDYINIIIE